VVPIGLVLRRFAIHSRGRCPTLRDWRGQKPHKQRRQVGSLLSATAGGAPALPVTCFLLEGDFVLIVGFMFRACSAVGLTFVNP